MCTFMSGPVENVNTQEDLYLGNLELGSVWMFDFNEFVEGYLTGVDVYRSVSVFVRMADDKRR
jgi:hypothetical protein